MNAFKTAIIQDTYWFSLFISFCVFISIALGILLYQRIKYGKKIGSIPYTWKGRAHLLMLLALWRGVNMIIDFPNIFTMYFEYQMISAMEFYFRIGSDLVLSVLMFVGVFIYRIGIYEEGIPSNKRKFLYFNEIVAIAFAEGYMTILMASGERYELPVDHKDFDVTKIPEHIKVTYRYENRQQIVY